MRLLSAALALTLAAALAAVAAGASRARLTIGVADIDPLTLAGTLSTGKAGESILIDARDCLAPSYRLFGGTKTRAGGGWRWVGGGVSSRTTFRARWRNVVSEKTVTIPRRIEVHLSQVPGRRVFRVGVFGRLQDLHGRPVELQRLDQREQRWVRIGVARLSRALGDTFIARFVVRRRGLLLRAAVPRRTAAPCFLPNVSSPVIS
jgi:hypothetical protein